MTNNDSERIITLTIGGKLAESGRVPIEILAEKLSALQESLFGVANAMEGFSGGTRGQWSSPITSSCKLVFKKISTGSLVIEAELEEPREETLTEEMDVGITALNNFKKVNMAIQKKDFKEIKEIMPNSSLRNRFLKNYESLCPDDDSYSVAIGNGKGKPYVALKTETKSYIQEMEETEIETKVTIRNKVVGEFIEIRVGDDKRHFALKTSRGEFSCNYPHEMESFISQVPPYTTVEVDCEIAISEDGSIKSIGNIYEVDIVNLEQPVFNKFIWENRKFLLKQPVEGKLKHEDGVWVYEIPKYDLYSFSEERKEAFLDLNEMFAFQYEEIAEEEDSKLTSKAIRLKKIIKNDIKEIVE